MTIEEIVNSLKGEIKEQLGFPAFLLPQKAVNNTAHIDLLFQDISENGEGNEKLIFNAEYRTAGTHAKWLTETIRLKRKIVRMNESEAPYMTVTDMKFRVYWIRNGNAGWRYPSEDESSMPAEYVIPYRIEIDIPTKFLED